VAAAIYARYSSENQRPESIDDQVSACRKLAKIRSLTISNDHIYQCSVRYLKESAFCRRIFLTTLPSSRRS